MATEDGGQRPPPFWILDNNGNKIRNPEHLAFMKAKWQTKPKESDDEDSSPGRKQPEEQLDCAGNPIPPKYLRQSSGKKMMNPDYLNNDGNRLSSTHEKPNLQAVTDMVDLSKDFQLAHDVKTLTSNPGARWIERTFGSMREVRRVTVIENGRLVADHRNPGCGKDDTHNLFSTTKGVMAVLIGVVLDQTDLEVTDTLGEIFADNPDAWTRLANNKPELAYKKSLRLEEILTMTSGLISMIGGKGIYSMKGLTVPDASGSDLARSLEAPDYNSKLRGKFHYMPSSNILSYVIREKTGLSPLEFAKHFVFPKLGIQPGRMRWEHNRDGVQTSFSQLYLTTPQMCKVGQLLLQDGFASPHAFSPMIPEDYPGACHAKHVFGSAGFDHWYGYLWSLYDRSYHGQAHVGDVWCAPGLNGQVIAVSRETNRVVAISRSPFPPLTGEPLLRYKKQVIKLLGSTLSYESLKPTRVPKKYVRSARTGKMIRNPGYDAYMEDLKQRSDGYEEDQVANQLRRRDSGYCKATTSNPFL